MKKYQILIIVCALLALAGTFVGIRSVMSIRQSSQTAFPPTDTPTVTVTPTDTPAPADTIAPTDTPAPTETIVPTDTPAPTDTSVATPEPTPVSGNGHIVAIDAGHQAHGNNEKEPIGPGASETKAKVASGTTGRVTGVPEYQLTLDVSLKLKTELENRGYTIIMIRETNDVNISNAERAEIANASGAEILLRLHGNGVNDTSVHGALTMAPTSTNPYVGTIADSCEQLSQNIVDAYCSATGFRNMGIQYYDNMSGINWCKIPVTILEMGFMTNADDDNAMQDQAMQDQMASGIADGVNTYFGIS